MEFNGITIVLTICGLLLLVGWLHSRRLPEAQMKLRFRKYNAVAGVIFLGCLFFTNPLISPVSFVSNHEAENPRNLETIESISQQTKEHDYRIWQLETEVKRLREDVYQAHQNYSRLLLIVVVGGAFYLIISAFNKKETPQNDD